MMVGLEKNLPATHHQSERALFLLFLSIRHLNVVYEPDVLTGSYGGRGAKTMPDFFIQNTKNPKSKGTFLEITSAECEEGAIGTNNDPKKRQRAILKQNGVRFVILYRHHLELIQKYYPELDFGLNKKNDSTFSI